MRRPKVICGIRWSNVVPKYSGIGNGMLLDGMELCLPINVPANSLQPKIWSLKMSSDEGKITRSLGQ